MTTQRKARLLNRAKVRRRKKEMSTLAASAAPVVFSKPSPRQARKIRHRLWKNQPELHTEFKIARRAARMTKSKLNGRRVDWGRTLWAGRVKAKPEAIAKAIAKVKAEGKVPPLAQSQGTSNLGLDGEADLGKFPGQFIPSSRTSIKWSKRAWHKRMKGNTRTSSHKMRFKDWMTTATTALHRRRWLKRSPRTGIRAQLAAMKNKLRNGCL